MNSSRFRGLLAVALGALLLACQYKTPVTTEHKLAIDPAVLGVWQETGPGGADKANRLLVLKFSDTEYLVQYPVGEETFYFRGWPVVVAGHAGVQLQALGDHRGPLTTDRLYQLVTYRLTDGALEIRTLNADVIDEDVATSAELVKLIEANREHPELFRDPGRFTRP